MKCIYKDIADNLHKDDFQNYYMSHTGADTAAHFNFEYKYLYRILHYLNIEVNSKERKSYISKNYICTDERNKKISQSNMGREVSEQSRLKSSKSQKGKPRPYTKTNPNVVSHQFQKGCTPWNKGLIGVQCWSDEQREKYYKTMDDKGWFKNSRQEDELFDYLKCKYEENDIIRQYREERYPFNCDFYIKSEDLFIELNYFWHHGPHRFNPSDENDLRLLEQLEQKSLESNSDNWKEFIYTWTVRDVLKFNTAEKNKLNYLAIYPDEFKNFIM